MAICQKWGFQEGQICPCTLASPAFPDLPMMKKIKKGENIVYEKPAPCLHPLVLNIFNKNKQRKTTLP